MYSRENRQYFRFPATCPVIERGQKERLSGIMYRCRAVYRVFALRSLVRVLYVYNVYYIYIALTRRRPGRFVCSPPFSLPSPFPLNIPLTPFGISRLLAAKERIRKDGYGWACFPLRGSTIVTRRLHHPSRPSTYFDFGRLFDCTLGFTKGGT